MRRVEDFRYLTGKGTFTDNTLLPNALHAVFLRSPIAHGVIRKIDTSVASQLPGVRAILTGEDAKKMSLPLASWIEPGWTNYCLAYGKVRYMGEPVAVVAATDKATAEDAAGLIDVDYEPLPPVEDAEKAILSDSIRLFNDKKSNVIYHRVFRFGDLESAAKNAEVILKGRIRWPRSTGTPIEPSAVVARYENGSGFLDVWSNLSPIGGVSRGGISSLLGVPRNKFRHWPADIGGSFGNKQGVQKYIMAISLLSKVTSCPVKYFEDRTENLSGNSGHGPDRTYDYEVAVKNDGTLLSMKIRNLSDQGAYSENVAGGSDIKPLTGLIGPYRIPAFQYEILLVATNKNPQAPYRGLGQSPHNLVLERVMDHIARELKMERTEVRLKNYIQPDEFPYTIPSGNVYDSGNYPAVLKKAMEIADYQNMLKQRDNLQKAGRYVGVGVATCVEPGGMSGSIYGLISPVYGTVTPESMSIKVNPSGELISTIGFATWGQAHETVIVQILADELGVSPEKISVTRADTLSASPFFGPAGSRITVALAGAATGAAKKIKEKALQIAAQVMEARLDDLEYVDGRVVAKGAPEMSMSLEEIARLATTRVDLLPAGMEPSLEATYTWNNNFQTIPDKDGKCRSYMTTGNSCHICQIEVDAETGKVKILKYVVVDDCGVCVNPLTAEGQTVGGIAQAIGASFMEKFVYDDSGQLVNSTFMDYLIPTAFDVPEIEVAHHETPSLVAPLGVKGIGEGGYMTAPSVLVSAVEDALRPFKTIITEIPMTPESIWKKLSDRK